MGGLPKRVRSILRPRLHGVQQGPCLTSSLRLCSDLRPRLHDVHSAIGRHDALYVLRAAAQRRLHRQRCRGDLAQGLLHPHTTICMYERARTLVVRGTQLCPLSPSVHLLQPSWLYMDVMPSRKRHATSELSQ